MGEHAIELSFWRVGIAVALVVVAGVISLAMRLSLEKKLAIASARTLVQLLLVGYVLEWVFGARHWVVVALAMLVMIFMAARAAVGRASRSFRGATSGAFVTLVLSCLVTTMVVTQLVVGVQPWHRARYVLPLLGMALGNSLTGISLCLDSMLEALSTGRARVEADLALGATRWEAAREPLAAAVRRGMIPILNAMTVVGVVSLPGMMTGQLLAGASPLDAVKYQIVVMFMLAASTSAGCILIALYTYRRLFDRAHRLRGERIERR